MLSTCALRLSIPRHLNTGTDTHIGRTSSARRGAHRHILALPLGASHCCMRCTRVLLRGSGCSGRASSEVLFRVAAHRRRRRRPIVRREPHWFCRPRRVRRLRCIRVARPQWRPRNAAPRPLCTHGGGRLAAVLGGGALARCGGVALGILLFTPAEKRQGGSRRRVCSQRQRR